MTTAPPAGRMPRSDKWGLARTIGVNAVMPYITYLALTRYGIATVPALVAGAIFPAADTVLGIVRSGRVEVLGIIVLAATGVSVMGALWFVSPFPVLAKGSLVTRVIGLIFMASLVREKPLVFYVVSSGKDDAARGRIDTLWRSLPDLRHLMRNLTWIWAVALLAEATLRLLLIPLIPITVFLPVSEMMWIAFFAIMTAWSWRYGARMRARMAIQQASTGPAIAT